MAVLSSSTFVQASIDNLDVVSSGVVHLEYKTTVTLKISTIELEFRFLKDEGEARYQGSVEGSKLILLIFNHKNVLGEGALAPLNFGSLSGRPHYVTYWVNTLDENKDSRRFEYVIYAERQNG